MAENSEQQTSSRPKNDPFRQQKLRAWQPIMTPLKVVLMFWAIGISFVPTGVHLLNLSNSIFESIISYDSSNPDVDCTISTANAGRQCTVMFNFTESVDGPLYLYYQLENFYQNHRRYVSSVDFYQLAGQSQSESTLDASCVEFVKNGSKLLNPCGLIANSFFNDVFTLKTAQSIPTTISLDESNIAWSSDKSKFIQPSGFEYEEVSSPTATCASVDLPSTCSYYMDPNTGLQYLYYYPLQESTQYLYQSYPNQISPILGITDEHFKVWMRPAALPTFRKLYGKIDGNFRKGDRVTIQIDANFEVGSFDGTKSLVLGNIGEFGGKNPYLGVAYIVVGAIALLFGSLFALKQVISPRPVADTALLNFNDN